MITEQQIQAKAKEYADTNIGEYAGNVNEVEHYAWKSAVDVFTAGAEWALQQQRWIPVKEELPEQFQRVMFVVDLPGNYKHGKVYGGTYTGDPKSESASLANGFSTPGWGAPASHWMPSPEPPTETT